MRIVHPHFVHPDDVAASGTLRAPLADPQDAAHPDYVAQARAWLEQYLVGEYHRLVHEDQLDRGQRYTELRATGLTDADARAQLPPRFTGRAEPVIHDLTEPYTTSEGVTYRLPHTQDGVTYQVGWIGTLDIHENR